MDLFMNRKILKGEKIIFFFNNLVLLNELKESFKNFLYCKRNYCFLFKKNTKYQAYLNNT